MEGAAIFWDKGKTPTKIYGASTGGTDTNVGAIGGQADGAPAPGALKKYQDASYPNNINVWTAGGEGAPRAVGDLTNEQAAEQDVEAYNPDDPEDIPTTAIAIAQGIQGNLPVSGEYRLNVKGYPGDEGLDNATYDWKTSNPKIATVEKINQDTPWIVVVKTHAKGTALITCTVKEIDDTPDDTQAVTTAVTPDAADDLLELDLTYAVNVVDAVPPQHNSSSNCNAGFGVLALLGLGLVVKAKR
jgi:hypothetical protein